MTSAQYRVAIARLGHERLLDCLDYHPGTGKFIWKGTRKFAGCRLGDGRIGIQIDGRSYLAHRLAWFYVHKKWPDGVIDHINGKHRDNRIANLRDVTPSQNQWNRGKSKRNTSGFKGVTWNPRRRKWYAAIQAHGHGKHLGSFNTAEDASQAYKTAAALHHQQYRRSSASFPKGATMTAGEYRDAINALKLTQVAAGAFLGVAPRTSRAWALGERPVPQAVAMLLRVMLRFGIEPEGCGE